MEQWIVHERDYEFTYAGLRQVIDKYLVQDRSTGAVYETPQFMYMLIALLYFIIILNQQDLPILKNIIVQ